LEYTAVVSGDEIDAPVDFCLSAIEELEEEGYDDGIEKAPMTYILCLTASRSPSKLVRARAMRALRKIFLLQASEFRPLKAEAALEDFKDNLEKLALLFRDRIAPARVDADGWETYLTLVRYFGFAGVYRARWAREALKVVGRTQPFGAPDPSYLETYRETVEALNLQAFYLTAVEGLLDRETIVRTEAIESLFIFPWNAVRRPLLENLEYNRLLLDPVHRIHLTRKLKAAAYRLETIEREILKYVVGGLAYSHAGVLHHSIDFLKNATGIATDDPGFWQDWWEDYVVKHAGDDR
jgi:hypothetical protein